MFTLSPYPNSLSLNCCALTPLGLLKIGASQPIEISIPNISGPWQRLLINPHRLLSNFWTYSQAAIAPTPTPERAPSLVETPKATLAKGQGIVMGKNDKTAEKIYDLCMKLKTYFEDFVEPAIRYSQAESDAEKEKILDQEIVPALKKHTRHKDLESLHQLLAASVDQLKSLQMPALPERNHAPFDPNQATFEEWIKFLGKQVDYNAELEHQIAELNTLDRTLQKIQALSTMIKPMIIELEKVSDATWSYFYYYSAISAPAFQLSQSLQAISGDLGSLANVAAKKKKELEGVIERRMQQWQNHTDNTTRLIEGRYLAKCGDPDYVIYYQSRRYASARLKDHPKLQVQALHYVNDRLAIYQYHHRWPEDLKHIPSTERWISLFKRDLERLRSQHAKYCSQDVLSCDRPSHRRIHWDAQSLQKRILNHQNSIKRTREASLKKKALYAQKTEDLKKKKQALVENLKKLHWADSEIEVFFRNIDQMTLSQAKLSMVHNDSPELKETTDQLCQFATKRSRLR